MGSKEKREARKEAKMQTQEQPQAEAQVEKVVGMPSQAVAQEKGFDLERVLSRVEAGTTPVRDLLRYLHGSDKAPEELRAVVGKAKVINKASVSLLKVADVLNGGLREECLSLITKLNEVENSLKVEVEPLVGLAAVTPVTE